MLNFLLKKKAEKEKKGLFAWLEKCKLAVKVVFSVVALYAYYKMVIPLALYIVEPALMIFAIVWLIQWTGITSVEELKESFDKLGEQLSDVDLKEQANKALTKINGKKDDLASCSEATPLGREYDDFD